MYLQLAEDRPVSKLVTNNYTFVPGINGDPGVWVRDDAFDTMNDSELSEIQGAVGLSELSQKAKRQARQQRKADKKSAKTEIKKARAESIRTGTRGQGVKDIIGGITSVAGSIFGGKPTPGGSESVDMPGSGGAEESKPFYKNPIFIGAGLLVVVGGIYLATRKK